MEKSKNIPDASLTPDPLPGGEEAQHAVQLLEKARADSAAVLKDLGTQTEGLSEAVYSPQRSPLRCIGIA